MITDLIHSWKRCAAGVLPVAGVLLLTSCQSTRESVLDDVLKRKYYHPTNFQGAAQLPVTLHRVLLLPLCGGDIVPPEIAGTLEEVFSAELQKQLRFEVVRLTREECYRRFGTPEFSSTAALPHDFLTVLGREFAAEAVLFIDLTAYHGYRPLQLGVRAKLATVNDTRLLWSLDEIYSAENPAVINSVRHFYGGGPGPGYPVDRTEGALQSPGKFAAYVAAATFNTLPPR